MIKSDLHPGSSLPLPVYLKKWPVMPFFSHQKLITNLHITNFNSCQIWKSISCFLSFLHSDCTRFRIGNGLNSFTHLSVFVTPMEKREGLKETHMHMLAAEICTLTYKIMVNGLFLTHRAELTGSSRIEHICTGQFPNWNFNMHWLKLNFWIYKFINHIGLHSRDMNNTFWDDKKLSLKLHV